MRTAKTPAAEASSHRRQPVRQTRTNPPRSSAASIARTSGAGAVAGEMIQSGPVGGQPIDIFPAITHFADAMTALPKELVRHFTLLKEVDAKIFNSEDQLFKLVDEASNTPIPDIISNPEAASVAAPGSAPMSVQGSSSGTAHHHAAQSIASADESHSQSLTVFDPANLRRRQLFRQTALKIQEMLVSLDEKNHVLSTANEALQRQLTRVDDVWPYLEGEFSDEAKWGSTSHWAYPENRMGKASQAERARRDGAAAISAAAQALVDEAAARSDARKQAVQAKRSLKNNHQETDEDHRPEGGRKGHGKSRKTADKDSAGLGISTAAGSNPPTKRRKVEKVTNGAAPMDRAMSSVFGAGASKSKAPTSPRETPAPDGAKKRKALPSGSGQIKKRNGGPGTTPSATSSPVLSNLPEPKISARASPAPGPTARPASSRARQNSIQSNSGNGRSRPASSAANRPNGKTAATPEAPPTNTWPRPPPIITEAAKEPSAPAVKAEAAQKETERPEAETVATPAEEKKEVGAEEAPREREKERESQRERRKSESIPTSIPMVTTKSGRASKPSTPALATFQEAARSRTARSDSNSASGSGNGHSSTGNGAKAHRKKASTASIALASRAVEEEANSSSAPGDEDGDVDVDEPTYCYCNSVSYGQMVACDADECEREWFHLACVGLKTAPGSKTKWYCEDCKERLKMGTKRVNGR